MSALSVRDGCDDVLAEFVCDKFKFFYFFFVQMRHGAIIARFGSGLDSGFVLCYTFTGRFTFGKGTLMAESNRSDIIVDYSVRPKDGFRTRFDHVSDIFDAVDTTERHESCRHLPVEGQHPVRLRSFFVGQNISTYGALNLMPCQGLRPATFEELVAFANVHPYQQLQAPIVAFGTRFLWQNGPCLVSCLHHSGHIKRHLRLAEVARVWKKHWRFLTAPAD